MGEPTTKKQVLDEIERAHQDMERMLASLSDEEKTAPMLDQGWSAQDSLAHLIAWEKMTMDWMTRSLQDEQVKRFIPGFQYESEQERVAVMEKLNTHLYEQNKNRALDDVMRDFRATHRAIHDFVAQLDERDLFDPNRFAWRNGSPALDMIGGNTYWHYDEHREWILQARAVRSFPTTKTELLKRIRDRHANMEQYLAALSLSEMTAPILDAGWSVQDTLAHIAAWENLALDYIAQYRRGETPKPWAEQFPVGEGTADEQMNRLNALWFEQNRARELGEVLDDFRSAFLRMIETVESLSQAEIFDANYFPSRKSRALIWLIVGDSYEHYDEHLRWISQAFEKNNS